MRMIGGTGHRDGGHLRVLGGDPAVDGRSIRARLGVVPQEDSLDPELTVAENLWVYGRYFDLPRRALRRRTDELLEFVALAGRRGDRVDELSGGMRRRLTVARGLVNDPELLLLDEPTTGLDPQARQLLWDRLRELRGRGVTMILTTHYMEEAEQLCDRIVVVDGGRVVAEGSPPELIAAHTSPEVVELRYAHDVRPTPAALGGLPGRTEILTDRVLVYAPDAAEVALSAEVAALRPEVVLTRPGTLEDVFLELTGRTLAS